MFENDTPPSKRESPESLLDNNKFHLSSCRYLLPWPAYCHLLVTENRGMVEYIPSLISHSIRCSWESIYLIRCGSSVEGLCISFLMRVKVLRVSVSYPMRVLVSRVSVSYPMRVKVLRVSKSYPMRVLVSRVSVSHPMRVLVLRVSISYPMRVLHSQTSN